MKINSYLLISFVIAVLMGNIWASNERGTLVCGSIEHALKSTKQLIVVMGDRWDSPIVKIGWFDRSKKNQWVSRGPTTEGRIGKNGFGWGIGIHKLKEQDDLQFRIKNYRWEGSEKSPAGVFSLGAGFGTDISLEQFENKKGNVYFPLLNSLHCVDDSDSPYYNQFVTEEGLNEIPTLKSIPKSEITSSEHMIEMANPADPRYGYKGWLPYRMGIFVNHNTSDIKADQTYKIGQWRQVLYPKLAKNMNEPLIQEKLRSTSPTPYGSCIFIHIMHPDGLGTAGCTGMKPDALHELMIWRKSRANTILIQLPRDQWQDISTRCRGLPVLK